MAVLAGARADAAGAVMLGGAAGAGWAAALRGWMSLIAGTEATTTWRTVPFVLAPGTIIGAAHGLAAHRRGRGRPVPRWVRWSPAAFAAPVLEPKAARQLVTTGIGSGAIFELLVIVGGGYALRPAESGESLPGRARAIVGGLAAAGLLAQLGAGAAMAGKVSAGRGAAAAPLGAALLALAALAATLGYDRAMATRR
ncbi:hypothetical protein [Agrococcus baldri]|uniref:Uncharacterized protein n=1 Tax=Agrococcus baldri TaxID=153730 RepID=A0AA87RB53_9MICO|nr:hypothetical protein [Agrococcus baldri]GEK79447.1 hypothetical protein ABA31_07980 [Agrococcus baldri]